MKIHFFWFFSFVFSTALLGTNINPEETEFSLEILLQVDIGVASKKEESVTDAPGVVTVITRQEIDGFGGQSLMELLERVPGIYNISSYLLPQSSFSIRGDYPGHTNAHILFLVDGRPVRDSILGGFVGEIITSFPISAVERIEVIRGPGSVLYGSNAYAGVINIITRESQDQQFAFSLGGGAESAKLGTISADGQIGELRIASDFYRYNEEGWNFDAFLAPDVPRNQSLGEDLFSARVSLEYNQWRLLSLFIRSDQDMFTTTNFPSQVENERLFMDLGYEDDVNANWRYSVNVTWNRIRNNIPIGSNIPNYPQTDDVVLETTHQFDFSDALRMVAGGTLFRLKGSWSNDVRDNVPEYQQTWWNTYFQMDYQATSSIKLIGGGQFNKPEGVDLDLVPRLGSIIRFNDRWGTKILYGEAFRAAFPGETQIRIPGVLLGTANLVPETIATLDLQLFYVGPNLQFKTTYFDSKQKNLITRVPSPDPGFDLEFSNRGSLESKGIELESKYVFSDNGFLMASVTNYKSRNDLGIENPSLLPETLAKFGGVITFRELGLRLGVFDTYASEPGKIETLNPNTARLNPDPAEHHNLTVNLQWETGLGANRDMNFTLGVYGTNLLDEEIYNPEFLFRRVNSVPAKGGSTVHVTARLSF